MAETKMRVLEGEWSRIAAGGTVTVANESGNYLFWIVSEGTTAPTLKGGHRLSPYSNQSFALEDGEHLWVKGSGTVFFTAANPVEA
ncbi:hypothetical protein [uncultured Jannaschia sp.]|uniref:hypothetical protein n=1 Tax=uncultured Jannaschia sp. TaxID=293347 RepID=UPI00260306A2|nr:hypothetical protein [uncultured Jannaschia sp.]